MAGANAGSREDRRYIVQTSGCGFTRLPDVLIPELLGLR
jgi:hypothetical protein